MKITFFLIATFFIGLSGRSQNQPSIDDELFNDFSAMMAADYQLRYDSLAPYFRLKLLSAIRQNQSLTETFDSLSTRMNIIQSEDQKVRIFSWDEKAGGSWHDMAVYAQYQTSDGSIKAASLSSGKETSTGEYTDVIIYEVYQIEINGLKYYLTMGWGTHGAGHHHRSVQIFHLQNDTLERCESCFQDLPYLAIEAPRSSKMNLQFDTTNLQLSHNEFVYNEDIGFYESTGKVITWKLYEGQFRK